MGYKQQKLAARYAQALLDVAAARNLIEAVRQDLKQASAIIASHAELQAALANPALPIDIKQRILESLFAKLATADLLLRFLRVLLTRGRIELLAEIECAFTALSNTRRGIVPATIISAVPLSADQLQRIEKRLAETAGKAVALEAQVDPRALGGVAVRMQGRLFDGTIRRRLKGLHAELTSSKVAS